MHRFYFPPCPVDGPIDPPVSYGHLATHGSVPTKCSTCVSLFEGSCCRHMAEVGHYLHLDHGPCGVAGPTDPIVYEDEFIAGKVEVPRKCATCVCLNYDRIYGFFCSKDGDKWGGFHRSLDWGAWAPDFIYLELPLPKITTKALSRFAQENDLLAFLKEHRRINLGVSLAEAREDFAHFRAIIDSNRSSAQKT